MLAWALKAAENSGRDVTEAVASAAHAPNPANAVLHLTHTAGAHKHAKALPPWITAPMTSSADSSDTDSQIIDYLNAAADEIRKRVETLTIDATQTRPAWVNALGAVPGDHARHQEWLHHVGTVAAYRDQYQVSSNDPRQVLGPCAEPGHAGHDAYWHAAESVLAARTIAGLEQPGSGRNDVGAQMTADLYLGLPKGERAAVSATMAERLGILWFGPRSETDDHAVTRPMYASQLAAALAERGLLSHEIATRESLARTSTRTVPVDEEPVEAAFARRRTARAAQGSTRDSARHREVRQAGIRETATRSSKAVSPHRGAAGPTERRNGPPLPLEPRPVGQKRDPGPMQ